MAKIVMCRGLPASGKTTFAKELITKEAGKWKRINKDDLRAMLDDGLWSDENEKFIVKVRDQLIVTALEKGQNVIVDDTNLHHKHEQRFRELAQAGGAEFAIQDFSDVTLEECIARDALREGKAKVGEKVIRGMYEQFMIGKVKVDKNLGAKLKQFAKTQEAVEKVEALPKPVIDPNLPIAIICDIDNTLAMRGDRGVYDFKKCGVDELCESVAFVLNTISQHTNVAIIICSGREDFFRDETVAWLKNKQVPYDVLLMRRGGDHRKDFIVKEEIYHNSIKNKYNILFILDDRQQVVDQWRQLGLKCFQVEPGKF